VVEGVAAEEFLVDSASLVLVVVLGVLIVSVPVAEFRGGLDDDIVVKYVSLESLCEW
jgi:hypothetical protein